MANIHVDFYSESLGLQTSVNVIIPQSSAAGQIGTQNHGKGNGGYRTLYLLHGLSDDHTIWARRTSIERYADGYGICVVMPAAARSFYTDTASGDAYYTYIAKELPARMREFFRLSDAREDNFVAGLSMGGYGALKIALREHGSFCAGAGLSSVCDMKNWAPGVGLTSVFGPDCLVKPEDDLYALADAVRDSPTRPRLFIGCGRQDGLYSQNTAYRDYVAKLGYDLTYRESDGEHTWAFWDEYIQYVLAWMLT